MANKNPQRDDTKKDIRREGTSQTPRSEQEYRSGQVETGSEFAEREEREGTQAQANREKEQEKQEAETY